MWTNLGKLIDQSKNPDAVALIDCFDVDQPRLADNGWKNEISSIQVKAGTWDFFSEDEFAGENMRLAPGPYPELGPQWTKHIGSFMCVQGG